MIGPDRAPTAEPLNDPEPPVRASTEAPARRLSLVQAQRPKAGHGRSPGAPSLPDPTVSSATGPVATRPKVRPSAASFAAWRRRYANTRNDTPAELFETIGLLRNVGNIQDVEAALTGYLTYHAKQAQPWMYESLALALEHNGAKPEAVKQALAYAAKVALDPDRGGYPTSLLTTADLLAARGWLAVQVPDGRGGGIDLTVGQLLDEAAGRLPHRAEPRLKSMDLALRERDAGRMAAAVEGLLALGWPGEDDKIRADARRRVESLARILRDADRPAEADALLARLIESERRDLIVRLRWKGFGDLDLSVEEPLGAVASFSTQRTVFGGSIVVNGRGRTPLEEYTCPRGFDGDYTITVATTIDDPADPARDAVIEVITREGTPDARRQTFPVDLASPAPIVVTLAGGRRKEALPFVAPVIVGAVPKPADEAPKPATTPGP